ncbi:MAG: FxsA family protein [Acidimicrobiia bacterium]|nr:FxsA family protein [Acidimicrobiia bacterium]
MVLVLVFLVAPLIELYVILQVAKGIGLPETILLLLAISFMGVWLAKMAGLGALRRLRTPVRSGALPSVEIIDGALVLLACALLIAPGFISDGLAIVLLLPPTRAAVRNMVLRRITAGDSFLSRVVAGSTQPNPVTGTVWEAEGWEDPPERPRLGP